MLKAVNVKLKQSIFKQRMDVNKRYMESLDPARLLVNFYIEAGLTSNNNKGKCVDFYGGWEKPDVQVRGSFTGHYMSACAMYIAYEKDSSLVPRLSFMADELELCGKEHLDGWCFSIPELYLDWIMKDKWAWAPQYTMHKTMMGLVDTYKFTGNEAALRAAEAAAKCIYNWCGHFTKEQRMQMLKWETGGMMEVFCDMYELTGNDIYRELFEIYCRHELLDAIVAGTHSVSFYHANTTIPEAIGAARAYEVTGDIHYFNMAKAFWNSAVKDRPCLVSGTSNNHELWMEDIRGKDSDGNQEFCTVYNMVKLADYLYRVEADKEYADYIERAYYNGYLAQQNRYTGANTYFLPHRAGAQKNWGNLTDSMYCCYGTQVQAHASYGSRILYTDNDNTVYLAQYIPFEGDVGNSFVSLNELTNCNDVNKHNNFRYSLEIKHNNGDIKVIKLRLPWWTDNMIINDIEYHAETDGYITLNCAGAEQTYTVVTERKIANIPMGGDDERVAFMYGPAVLAGLCGDATLAGTTLCEDKTINLNNLVDLSWYSAGPEQNIKFKQLYDITDEEYSVYFKIK